MINIKSMARKYDLEIQELDDCYYKALNQVKKIDKSILNEELLSKYLEDKLEEMGIEYKDINVITSYYIKLQEEEIADKIVNTNEEPIDVIEDEMEKDRMEGESIQTSNNTGIDSTIGRNRRHGYDTELINMYNK